MKDLIKNRKEPEYKIVSCDGGGFKIISIATGEVVREHSYKSVKELLK